MKSYKNKTIWITGASSGIGEAVAYAFAKEQSNLILSDINESKLFEVKNNCDLLGAKSEVFAFDLEETEKFPGIVESVIKKFKQIDVLINNGGISQRSRIDETSLDIDKKIMNINYFGNIYLTKLVLPHMKKNGGGQVAATTSIVGKFGFPLRSAYSASKHALYGFYETLRLEMASENIKVSMICPGRVQTNISMNALNKEGKKHNQMDKGQETGITVEKSAKIILKGLRKEKKEIMVGGKELLMVYFKKYLPFIFNKIAGKIKPT
jgi:short-subunit dehydrogenase